MSDIWNGEEPYVDYLNRNYQTTGLYDPNDPNVPDWKKAGFPDEASWAAIYRRPAANTVVVTPPPAQTTPSTSTGNNGPWDLTNEQKSAKAAIDATLGQYGLASLGDNAWKAFLTGVPIEQIMLDIRNTPEYKTRFPAMQTLSQKGRAINESQYIDWERQATQVLRQAGLPSSFYDQPDDFAKFIGNEVSTKEFADRVQMASEAAQTAAPQVRQQLSTLYGADPQLLSALNPGTLTAFFLDPDKAEPLIQKQYTAAKLGAQSQLTGYGQLNASTLEGLASQGVTEQQAQEGFGNLADMSQLFNTLPGQQEDNISQQEQLGAAFSNDAAAKERIRRKKAAQLAAFGGGGAFAGGSSSGTSGLGSAS